MSTTTRERIFDGDAVARRLASMGEVEDRRAGIRERFLTPSIGGGRTVAVLATPLADPHEVGWVVCHSFGMEQVTLATHEVPIARALAAEGSAVLRYHGQGYGDSELGFDGVGLASHVRDALDAAAVLVDATGVERVAFLGARLGGTSAAIAAERMGSPAFVAWEPVVLGRPYARSLLTLSVLLQLMHQERDDQHRPDPAVQLAEHGVLDVQGFPLWRETYDELTELDLAQDIRAFRGSSLIAQISKTAKPNAELERFATHLRDLGGTSEFTVIQDERANTFGEPRYRPTGGGHKTDVQHQLGEALVARTLSWCRSAGLSSAPGGSR